MQYAAHILAKENTIPLYVISYTFIPSLSHY